MIYRLTHLHRVILTLLLAFAASVAFAAAPTTGQFLFQRKPSTGAFTQFGVTPTTGYVFGWDGTDVVMIDPTAGAVLWGGITGTLSNQSDLQTALNLKQATAGVLALGGFSSITGTVPLANLGSTTVGGNLLTLANPSAVSFLRVNADNTVTSRTAAEMISDLGAATPSSNVATATALATARNIFGISFNGTANVAGDAVNTGHYASIPGTGAAGHFVTENGTAPTLIAGRSAWYSDGSGVPSFKSGIGAPVTLVRSSDLGTGIATFLIIPSSANLASAVTGETGTGALTFATSPTFTTSIIAGSSTMALLNTTATTVNAFGAATNIVMGGATTSGTATTSGLAMTFNSLTSGTGVYIATNSSGPMMGGAKLLDIVMTGNGPSSGSFSAANVTLSGTNLFSSTTTTGATISNTRTGSSATNNALTLTASGGTTNTALNITAGNSLFPDGTASAPSIQFGSDTNTGIYRIGADNIGIATNGILRWHVSSGGNLFSGSGNYDYNIGASLIKGSSGSASAPTFTFGTSGDENTGMYRYAEDKIGWATGGSARMSLETGILRLGTSMTATCSASSYLLIEEGSSAGICLSRTSATTGKYSLFVKGTGDFGFYDELNARYAINIEKSTGYVDAVNGLKVATGTAIVGILSATATLDFPSIAGTGGTQDLTITVTGAVTGNVVSIGLPAAPNAGVTFNAFVSASNTVTLRATNATALAIDPASASYRVMVTKF